jgi:hypothetical protein
MIASPATAVGLTATGRRARDIGKPRPRPRPFMLGLADCSRPLGDSSRRDEPNLAGGAA